MSEFALHIKSSSSALNVYVSIRVAQIKKVVVLMAYFLLSDHYKNVYTCTFHSNKTLSYAP